ncbi:hypothetical protein HAX54_011311 [Datura stramonium]|uniref:Uncharacterized protein n=1 Tax=Datura stramonium TaxID=4076 RepID=A0ABS8TJI3_DATST|nr:hypothetical protein [Datura stramonium]
MSFLVPITITLLTNQLRRSNKQMMMIHRQYHRLAASRSDFSELTKTLTRQFWGVASFLAPPPQSEPDKPLLDPNSEPARDSDDEESDPVGSRVCVAILLEIGGRFKSVYLSSKNIPVSEITKMASNLLQLGPEEEEEEEDKRFDSGGGAVGVTGEVVAFVRTRCASWRPGWTFLLDDED